MIGTVLISGGSGLIGQQLAKRLRERGYEPVILSRTRSHTEEFPSYIWDPEKGVIDPEAISKADYIIHLSGINIGEKRWSTRRQKQILDSRTKSGQLLFDEVKKQKRNLRAFISASATGYYGALTSEKIFIETDLPGEDFLGRTCKKWEHMADSFTGLGIRTVKIRTGVVLTNEGGALPKMLFPIKKGFGTALGTGNQYFPWIHMDDLCGIYMQALADEKMQGAYNAVSPEHVTNREFTRILAKLINMKLWLPNIPSLLIKLIFGKMSEILLKGSRISSDKIQARGYKFLFPGLNDALRQILSIESA